MNDHPTFEETYPKYEFSELVRLGLAMAAWSLRMVQRAQASGLAELPAPPAPNKEGAA
jgi:hypothetical protein